MKLASIVSGVLFALYAVFLLVWLWGDVISWEILIKTTLTVAIIIVATMGLALLYREYIEERGMEEKGYLD